MAYVAVDEDGEEKYSNAEFKRVKEVQPPCKYSFSYKADEILPIGTWLFKWRDKTNNMMTLPKGSIEKLIGRKLTWEDEPVELEEYDTKNKNKTKD